MGLLFADPALPAGTPTLAEQFAAMCGRSVRYGRQPERPPVVPAVRAVKPMAQLQAELAEAERGFDRSDAFADNYATWKRYEDSRIRIDALRNEIAGLRLAGAVE